MDTLYLRNKNAIITASAIITDITYAHGKYFVYYKDDTIGNMSLSIIGSPGTGVQFGEKKFIIDKDGNIDIKGIKECLYNRKISNLIDKL